MTPLFKKLNLRSEAAILVLDAPDSFEAELALLEGVQVVRSAAKAKNLAFAMAFVTTLAGLDKVAAQVAAKAQGDLVLWMVYPKQSSKRYTCEFHRDTGWAALEALGYASVRMVAVDQDWSALRFRKTEFVGR